MESAGCQDVNKHFNPILFSHYICNESCTQKDNTSCIFTPFLVGTINCIPCIVTLAFIVDIISCPCRCANYYNYHWKNKKNNSNKIVPIIEEQPVS